MNLVFQISFLISMLFIITPAKTQEDESREQMNVLFIIADDLTTTALSCYGNPIIKTPNIDELANSGTMYTRAYSQYPVCGPSRASMLFGYYPSATETYGYVSGRKNVGESKLSLPQLFKTNGYTSTRVSKIYHMGVPIDIEKGTNGKDDDASWSQRFNSQGPEWRAEGDAELVQNNPYGKLERKGGNVMTIVEAEGGDLVHSDGRTAEKAVELIEAENGNPFFLAIGFVRPHVPFVAPREDFVYYPFRQMVVPPKVQNDWNDIPSRGINYVTSVNGQMSSDQEKKAISAYYASVTYMDRQVGKVIDALKSKGLYENTIIVFTSDHGFHLGEHEFWMKVSLHEESVRVPMIIKVPGKDPAICNSFVELLDLYPTLADLSGLKPVQNLQGESLIETFDDPHHEVREYAFSVSQGGRTFLIRNEKWAYIQYDEDAGAGMELFDMKNDPGQFNNLALNPSYAEIVQDLQGVLRDKLKEVRINDLGIDYNK